MIHMMLMMVIMMFFNDHDIMIEIASQSDGPRVTPLPPEVVAVRADRTVRNMLLLLLLLLLCHAIVYVRAYDFQVVLSCRVDALPRATITWYPVVIIIMKKNHHQRHALPRATVAWYTFFSNHHTHYRI